MRVTYDFRIFGVQQYGGISRYFYELARRIARFEEFEVEILAPIHMCRALSDSNSVSVFGRYIPHIPFTTRIRNMINAEISKWMLRGKPPDIVHETYYSETKLASKTTSSVITVYDMIHERLQKLLPGSENIILAKACAIARADRVICISDCTKRDMLELLNVDSRKVSVIHLASSLAPLRDGQDAGTKEVDRPYVLYVGNRWPYKNFRRLLHAYAASNRLRRDFRLVCFGGKPFSAAEIAEMAHMNIPQDNVLHVTGDDEKLAAYYSGAAVFVLPSLYEGFGISLLEAMSRRCPIACSNTGSMPEVAGNAAEYFDPYEVDSIKAAIERIVGSPTRSTVLASLGSQRVKQFSWQDCADRTRQIYSSLG